MSMFISDLDFDIHDLEVGDNAVRVSFQAFSSVSSVDFTLEVLQDPNVKFHVGDSLKDKTNWSDQISGQVSPYDKDVVIHVNRTGAIRTPVTFIITGVNEYNESWEDRKTIFY